MFGKFIFLNLRVNIYTLPVVENPSVVSAVESCNVVSPKHSGGASAGQTQESILLSYKVPSGQDII